MKSTFTLLLASLALGIWAQPEPAEIRIDGIPKALNWVVEPENFTVTDGIVSIEAAAKTNMFYAPHGNFRASNMPKLLFEPDEDFTFSVKAATEHRSKWDAAMLVVYVDEDYWAKFCFENESPGKNRMVTVVTNEISDDAYSDYIPDEWVYMQIEKKGRQVVFSYSLDGDSWVKIRYFRLNKEDGLRVGLASQSPIGEGLTSMFSEIRYQVIQAKE